MFTTTTQYTFIPNPTKSIWYSDSCDYKGQFSGFPFGIKCLPTQYNFTKKSLKWVESESCKTLKSIVVSIYFELLIYFALKKVFKCHPIHCITVEYFVVFLHPLSIHVIIHFSVSGFALLYRTNYQLHSPPINRLTSYCILDTNKIPFS